MPNRIFTPSRYAKKSISFSHASSLLLVTANPPTPPSLLVSLSSCRIRGLLDTGASVCLLKDFVFRSLPSSFKLLPAKINLQIIAAASMNVIGRVYLPITLTSVIVSPCFYVVCNMNRSATLGCDFFVSFWCCFRYKSNTLNIRNEKIP